MRGQQPKLNQLLNSILGLIFLILIGLSVYEMAFIAFPYFVPPFPTNIDFLASKQWIVEEWYWLAAFYIHISSAVFVIAAGLTQFSKTLLFQYPKWHRNIGKSYVFLILFVAGPSGFVMAFYGNGGFWARLAFVLQAVLWWGLTYKAYQTIRKGAIKAHGKYMLRSYAMTLSAISLRAATYLVSDWKLRNGILCPNTTYHFICYPDFYILVAWLSWGVNLIVAEVLIRLRIMNYYFPT
jgi:uncharacterized membrane protein